MVAEVKVIGRRAVNHGAPVGEAKSRAPYPKTYRADGVSRAVYLSYTDLCEIGYEIANGFLRYAPDWGYWCVSNSGSWLDERRFYRWAEADAVFVDEIVKAADVLHLCEYHSHSQLGQVWPGKRMVIHHHGCYYRDNPQQYERAEIEAGYTRLVSTPDLLIHGSAAGRKTLRWLPSPVNVSELQRNYPVGERRSGDGVVVCHAYTVAKNKGSDLIISTVHGMRPQPTLNLIHGLNRRESVWHIRQCDIYVATMLYGPGMASLEAMAMGIPVVLGCTADELAAQKECYGEELPFVHVTPDTLEKRLKALIADEPRRRAMGELGRKAVARLHDVPRVVERLQGYYADTKPSRSVVRP
jgi:hypothetical protein